MTPEIRQRAIKTAAEAKELAIELTFLLEGYRAPVVIAALTLIISGYVAALPKDHQRKDMMEHLVRAVLEQAENMS